MKVYRIDIHLLMNSTQPKNFLNACMKRPSPEFLRTLIVLMRIRVVKARVIILEEILIEILSSEI